jgi:hypothetical protein
MEMGRAVAVDGLGVDVIIAVWVWVGLTGMVIVATDLVGAWAVIWVGGLDVPGRLQADRTTTSERDINGNLNVFNVAFMIAAKNHVVQFGVFESARSRQLVFAAINHIH